MAQPDAPIHGLEQPSKPRLDAKPELNSEPKIELKFEPPKPVAELEPKPEEPEPEKSPEPEPQPKGEPAEPAGKKASDIL